MTDSKIEWTEKTWNPTRGCRRTSPGCLNCYAERQAIRHAGPGRPYEGLARSTPDGPRWTGKGFMVDDEKLKEPLSWRKPSMVFVDSMSDLFFEEFTVTQIASVYAVMAKAHRHTFQVLTKRAHRMQKILNWEGFHVLVCRKLGELFDETGIPPWPLPNVWQGVSAEDDYYYRIRMDSLARTPAAVRFVSAEPLLGRIHVKELEVKPDWIIVGGESGPAGRARPSDPEWMQKIVADCRELGIKVFVKQLGDNPVGLTKLKSKKGKDPAEWPLGLCVREFPGGDDVQAA